MTVHAYGVIMSCAWQRTCISMNDVPGNCDSRELHHCQLPVWHIRELELFHSATFFCTSNDRCSWQLPRLRIRMTPRPVLTPCSAETSTDIGDVCGYVSVVPNTYATVFKHLSPVPNSHVGDNSIMSPKTPCLANGKSTPPHPWHHQSNTRSPRIRLHPLGLHHC
jgi:hypothetical protein